MDTSTSLQIIRDLGDIRGEILDLYYKQDDLNSETSRAILAIGKKIDAVSSLAAFGPKEARIHPDGGSRADGPLLSDD